MTMHQDFKKALKLEYFTILYSIVEAVFSIFAGTVSGSVALVSFGVDSIAESMSGVVLVWRLRRQSDISSDKEERMIERKAQNLVGLSFILLAIYVLYETVKMLVTSTIPQPSPLGIIIAIFALITMPLIAYKKHRLGEKLFLGSLKADAKETLVCSLLSLALLLGLVANYLWGLWQLDPVVSLMIVVFLIKEGRELVTRE